MRKLRLLPFMLMPLCLMSCGSSGYVGRYSFQMGKSKGSHITATVELSKDDYVDSHDNILGKKAEFFVQAVVGEKITTSVSNPFLSTSEEEPIASEPIDISEQPIASEPTDVSEAPDTSMEPAGSGEQQPVDPVIPDTSGAYDALMAFAQEGISIHGYYKVGEPLEHGRKILSLGVSLDMFEELSGTTFEVPSAFIEMILYSEIDAKSVILTAPVSMRDLEYQLYWYGLDIYHITNDDLVSHPVNTHPTNADIEEINKTYPDAHEGRLYRDFHVFSLSLLRE